jgi:hypothetical protein
VCVFVACKAHAPYCHLWPSPIYNVFPYFLINGTLFVKKNVTEHKMYVLILSTVQYLSETFLTLRRNERDMTQNVYSSSCALYSCPIRIKLEYSRQIFEKSSNTKFHPNPSSRSRAVPCARTDRYDAILRTHLKSDAALNPQLKNR